MLALACAHFQRSSTSAVLSIPTEPNSVWHLEALQRAIHSFPLEMDGWYREPARSSWIESRLPCAVKPSG